MSKDRKASEFLLRKWIEPSSKELTTDGVVVFCKVCEKNMIVYKKHHVGQHLQSRLHIVAKSNKNPSATSSQTLIRSQKFTPTVTVGEFNMDLADALISANIPWSKVNHPKIRALFQKYMGQSLPDEELPALVYSPLI